MWIIFLTISLRVDQICLLPGSFHQGLDPHLQRDPLHRSSPDSTLHLVLPGEIGEHNVSEATRAAIRYATRRWAASGSPEHHKLKGFFFFFFYFLFLQSHTLGGRNLELSKIGCVPVFRPVPYPPLWKSLMVKKTLSHIIRSTRKMALVQFLKGKSCIFPKHIWLHHSLNGHFISYQSRSAFWGLYH